MSRHHRTTGWNGAASRNARKAAQPLVDSGRAVCPRCRLPIQPGQEWDAGHVVDVADIAAGADARGIVPEHRSCNRRAGGKRGARITNARRAAANNFRSW